MPNRSTLTTKRAPRSASRIATQQISCRAPIRVMKKVRAGAKSKGVTQQQFISDALEQATR